MAIRFAILGSGSMGQVYARSISAHGRSMELSCIALGTRASGLAQEYGVDLEPDARSALSREDVDAVVIATPHSTHLELARESAAAGKHIFLEKPMALTVRECDEILEACRSADVKLTINALTRYRGAPKAAKQLIDEGRIGEIRMVHVLCASAGYDVPDNRWITDPREGTVFLDWGTHGCDVLRWLTESEPVSAYAVYNNYGVIAAVQPSAMVTYALDSGVMSQIWMSWELPPPGLGSTSQWMIVGSDGMIDLDAYGKLLVTAGDGWEEVFEQPPFDWERDPLSEVRLRAYVDQLQEFVDVILEGGQPFVTGEDGRAAVEMVEAADRSAATGEVIRLPLVPATA